MRAQRDVLTAAITAPARLQEQGIRREQLSDPVTFLHLQKLIVRAHKEQVHRCLSGPFISDRGVVDALGYAAWRFGQTSREII